jgi:hypothetical protein
MLVDGRALICGCSGFSKPANTPNRFTEKRERKELPGGKDVVYHGCIEGLRP